MPLFDIFKGKPMGFFDKAKEKVADFFGFHRKDRTQDEATQERDFYNLGRPQEPGDPLNLGIPYYDEQTYKDRQAALKDPRNEALPGELKVPIITGLTPVRASEIESFLAGEMVMTLNSSWLSWADYFPESKTLRIGYKNDHVGRYWPVDEEMVKDFVAAPSKGRWVHHNLKVGMNPDGTWVHATQYRAGM